MRGEITCRGEFIRQAGRRSAIAGTPLGAPALPLANEFALQESSSRQEKKEPEGSLRDRRRG